MPRFDVVILGGGAGAEAVCGAGLGGRTVAVVEELRFGGGCPFVACMPSKAMLHSAAERVGGVATRPAFAPADYRSAADRRDRVVEHRDDSQHLSELQGQGVETIRGRGKVVAPGVVEVNGDRLEATDLVIATGSEPTLPPIQGLADVDYWLSDRVLTTADLPESALVLGGGPVGAELAQILARYGCETSLIEVAPRLLGEEEPELGRALAATLGGDGVEVLVGQRVVRASSPGGLRVRLDLEDGSQREAQILVVATGRRPRIADLGLELYQLPGDARALSCDRQGRALGQAHLFGVGDVTGVAPFTHTANYQGRVVAANLRGESVLADYRAIPRAIYTDPPLAAVGLTRTRAAASGISVASASFPLAETARALAEDVGRGEVVIVTDAAKGVLVGAAAAGPGADESIGWAALAIRTETPLSVLLDTVAPFPTYAEAYLAALRSLAPGSARS
ncbi:MAG TPA: NAD(P)/FAD-dependent oxidoreductase [Candidatus Dormibacteraeota bacterium]